MSLSNFCRAALGSMRLASESSSPCSACCSHQAVSESTSAVKSISQAARLLFFRQLRALWLCLLVLWKYMQSTWEAKRLCEEDAKRFLSARYRRSQVILNFLDGDSRQ